MKTIKTSMLVALMLISTLLVACETDTSETADRINATREGLSGQSFNNDSKVEDDIFVGQDFEKATVIRAVDGDTIDVKFEDGREERVRMILINTPESTGEYKENPQPFGKEASDFTAVLLEGADVWLEYDTEKLDRYDRTLAYVWLKETHYTYQKEEHYETEVMFNELLLKHGLAHVAVYEPNVRYKNRFYVIENKAKRDLIGVWGQEEQ